MKKFVALVVILAVCYYLFQYDSFDKDSLRGKKVLITGGSRGLGEQLAYQYSSLGAHVLITARNESKLKQVVARCQDVSSMGGYCTYRVHDFNDSTAPANFIRDAKKDLGAVDILILNHIAAHDLGPWLGTALNHSLLDLDMMVDYKSHVLVLSHALPLLEQSHGQIIVIGSLTGIVPQPYITAYEAAKAAQMVFFNGLRQEFILRDNGVCITDVVLGMIGTEMALDKMRRFKMDHILDLIQPPLPSDAAQYIVRTASARPWTIYYPYYQNVLLCMLQNIIPRPMTHFQLMLYKL